MYEFNIVNCEALVSDNRRFIGGSKKINNHEQINFAPYEPMGLAFDPP